MVSLLIITLVQHQQTKNIGSGEGYEDQGNCGVKAHTTVIIYLYISRISDICNAVMSKKSILPWFYGTCCRRRPLNSLFTQAINERRWEWSAFIDLYGVISLTIRFGYNLVLLFCLLMRIYDDYFIY